MREVTKNVLAVDAGRETATAVARMLSNETPKATEPETPNYLSFAPLQRHVRRREDEKTGQPLPLHTRLTAQFPLLSRRERRALARGIAKEALNNVKRGAAHGPQQDAALVP